MENQYNIWYRLYFIVERVVCTEIMTLNYIPSIEEATEAAKNEVESTLGENGEFVCLVGCTQIVGEGYSEREEYIPFKAGDPD